MNKPPNPAVKAFCVGQAKSGTASVAGLLAANHRAAHEPERVETLAMILRESRGEVSVSDFREQLRARDERLNLEYDIAWANQFMVGHLLATFPDAKFIILIRDPFTWLDSVAGHLMSRDIPADVCAFLDWWFKPERYPHTHRDSALRAHGLHSAAAFLHAWDRHVTSCTESIPPPRRLILKTHELARSHQVLADFLKVPVAGLDTSRGYINRRTSLTRVGALIARDDLDEMIGTICGENLAKHFPGVVGVDDIDRLWGVEQAG